MMNSIRLTALGIVVLPFVTVLSACAGSGGSSGTPAAVPNTAARPGASPAAPSAATAHGTITIRIPRAARGSSSARKPAYISPGTTGAAVFIDGATTPAGSTTSCTSACTIAWSAALSVPAAHTFAVEIDNGTSVLAENEHSYAIVFGANGALTPTLTLNGVAASAALTVESCAATTCTGTLQVADATGNPITNSGSNPNFDNGTITYASATPSTGTVASGGTIATVSTAGTYAYTTACATNTGQFQTTMTASIPAGSGDITAAELTNRSLVYPSSINQLELYRCTTANAILPGHIYVSTQAGKILVFAGNLSGTVNVAPLATIVGGNTGLNNPLGIALDSSGQIYIANSTANGVSVFAANPSGTLNETPVATIAGSNTTLTAPAGLGLDSTGKVYVANGSGDNAITVYAASPSGTMNEAPVATITGGNTGLNNPGSIQFDSAGHIYTGSSAPSIQMFPASPSGTLNEAPLATITGGNTGLNIVYGIAVDSNGKIYAANNGSSSITVYAANPSGTMNEIPVATISGSNTGLSAGVFRVATDYNRKIYAGLAASVSVFQTDGSGNLTPLWTITGSNTGLGGNVSGIAIR
jgi:sugar lactone lactonase YvrE